MKHYINSDHHPVRKAQCRQLAEALQDFLSDLARSSLSIREFRAETGCLPGEGAQCLVYFVSRFTLIGINDLEERFGEQTDEANRNRAFVIRNVEIFYHDREKLNHQVPYMAEPRSGLIKKEGRTLSYICVSLGGISLLAGLGTARFNRLDIKKGTS